MRKELSKEDYSRVRVPKNLKSYTHINGELFAEEIRKAGYSYASFGRKILSTGSMVRESIIRNYIMTKYLTLIYPILDKPEGYFDYKEPVKEEITEEPVKEEMDTFKPELFVELKKIEALLISINRKLDGKATALVLDK